MTTGRRHYRPDENDPSGADRGVPATRTPTTPARTPTTAREIGDDGSRAVGAPDRIVVQPRPGSPGRIHVRAGDVVYEGDPLALRRTGERTPRVNAWTVVDVTPDRVVARHVDTGVEFDWDRAALETGLLTGRYAVDLVGSDAATVRPTAPGRERSRAVIATAYGNDGSRYVRRFIVGGEADGATRVAPWTETPTVSGLLAELRESFDGRVAEVLRREGYVLSQGAVTP